MVKSLVIGLVSHSGNATGTREGNSTRAPVAPEETYIIYHCVELFLLFFFFSSRRRHTRFDCDWSSDVCSSDLRRLESLGRNDLAKRAARMPNLLPPRPGGALAAIEACPDADVIFVAHAGLEIGRASCRERV